MTGKVRKNQNMKDVSSSSTGCKEQSNFTEADRHKLSKHHLCYANTSINIYLSILYNLCLFYGVIPDNCLALIIIPIVKDKNKDLQDVYYYRPTAVVSTISKLFERFILNQINPFLQTAHN